MTKRLNHEVTRSYLEQWLDLSVVPPSLHWIDLKAVAAGKPACLSHEPAKLDQRKNRYKAPAGFAIHDYAYVPLVDNVRVDDLEDEFAELENQMIRLCRAQTNQDFAAIGRENLKKALMGCVSHAFRDVYTLQMLFSKISGDSNVAHPMSSLPPGGHEVLLDNLKGLLDAYNRLFRSLDWKVIINLPALLITSERPCFDMSLRKGEQFGMIVFPLSPNSMLIGVKGGGKFGVADGSKSREICDMWNYMTVERARHWIVGDAGTLHSFMPVLGPEHYDKRVRLDSVGLVVMDS